MLLQIQTSNIHGEKRKLFLKEPINKCRNNNKVNKNHHLATIMVISNPSKKHQQMLKPGGINFDEEQYVYKVSTISFKSKHLLITIKNQKNY